MRNFASADEDGLVFVKNDLEKTTYDEFIDVHYIVK